MWVIRVLIIAGLGCSIFYSTQLFDGIKTAKTFYFIMVVFWALFFLSGRVLWSKKPFTVSLSLPDILLALYVVWAFLRLHTSNTDSVHNLYFWEFSACVLWYFCVRSFFFAFERDEKFILFFIILLGYVQLIVCCLQLTGMMESFSPIFPVSGTFDNTSVLCIYLTCILPITVNTGLIASDTTSAGKFVRTVCLLSVLCWIILVLMLGSRTSLLSGCIGMAIYIGFQTEFFGYIRKKTNMFVRKTLISTVLLFMICGLVFLLAQYKKDSTDGRLLIWKVAWTGIKDVPLQGHGFNAFQAKYGHYQAAYFQKHVDNPKERWIASNMTVAMNDFVEITFNLGFIGLFLFVAFGLSLFKGFVGDFESGSGRDVIAVTVLVIFLVSSGFYFAEKMLPVKTIALFFAAYAGSISKNILKFHIRALPIKIGAAILMIFCCFAGYATVNKVIHYVQWEKAEALSRFGYTEEAGTVYKNTIKHMRNNGLFLFFYAKNLYENKAYQQCIEYMEMAKSQVTDSDFYMLSGDAYINTGDYDNAISFYQYAADIVPNRFRPLHKLFNVYKELGGTQQALAIAHTIKDKPVKVDSYEVRKIKKECIDFIQLNIMNKDE